MRIRDKRRGRVIQRHAVFDNLFTLAIKPSALLALALTAMAGTALFCSWISLPPVAFLPVAAGVGLAWWWQVGSALQRQPRTALLLEARADGTLRWKDRMERWHTAGDLSGSYVSAHLIILNLAAEGGHRMPLVLLADSAAPDDLRRLRVWLRWRLDLQ